MSFWNSDPNKTAAQIDVPRARALPVGPLESLKSSFDYTKYTQTGSGVASLFEERQKETGQLYAVEGKRLGITYPEGDAYTQPDFANVLSDPQAAPRISWYNDVFGFLPGVDSGMDRYMQSRNIRQQQKAREAINAALIAEGRAALPSIDDDFAEAVKKRQSIIDEENRQTELRTAAGKASAFAGAVGGMFTDPVNIYATAATAPLTAASVPARIGIAALTNAAAELLNQAAIEEQTKAYGVENVANPVANVAVAGAGGAVIQGGVEIARAAAGPVGRVLSPLGRALARGIGRSAEQAEVKAAEQALAAFRKSVLNPTAEERAAEIALTKVAEVEAPLVNVVAPASQGAAEEAQEAVARAMVDHKPLPETPLVPLDAKAAEGAAMPPSIEPVRVKDLLVDAKAFQFKEEGADEFGVLPTLRGIKEWEPSKSGTVIVWEAADGTRYVADGHQRTALARRIMAEQPDKDIYVNAYIWREADGVTREQAKLEAASVNLSQGTGSATDLANLLRSGSENVKRFIKNLPPNSIIVQTSKDVQYLNDVAYRMWLKGSLENNYARAIGSEASSNPEYHTALADLLMKVQPSNLEQSRSVVRQAMAQGFDLTKTEDLFGSEVLAESLFVERARILDMFKKDAKLLSKLAKGLDRNREAIESIGRNRLDAETNKAVAQQQNDALHLVEKLANMRGEISDALTEAARYGKQTGRWSEAAGRFSDNVRRAGDSGNLARLAAGATADAPTASSPGSGGNVLTPDQIAKQATEEAERAGEAADTLLAAAAQKPAETQPAPAIPERAIPKPATVKALAAAIKKRPEIAQPDKLGRTLSKENQRLLAAIYEQAEQAKPVFDEIATTITRQLDEAGIKTELKLAPLKGPARAVEKALADGDGDPRILKDIVRGTIIVDNLDEVEPAFSKVIASFQDGGKTRQLLRPDAPSLGGYRDAFRNVNINGHIGEIQVNVRRMIEAKDVAHSKYYEVIRSLEAKQSAGTMTPEEETLLGNAKLEQQQFYDGVWSDILADQAARRASKSASEISPALSLSTSVDGSAAKVDPSGMNPVSDRVLPSSLTNAPVSNISQNLLDDIKSPPVKVAQAGDQVKPEQTVLPGAEAITNKELAERQMAKPLTGGNQPADFGLFDTESRKQIDMFGLPGDIALDADGAVVAVAKSVDDIVAETADDDALVNAMKGCLL